MHRFWVFPLVLSIAGALYPVICFAEAYWAINFLRLSRPYDWVHELPNVLLSCLPYGLGSGVLLGLGAAWREHRRPGAILQSGAATATRLVGNIGWLLLYALLFNASNGAMLGALVQSGWVSRRVAFTYFPGALFVGMGLVNLLALVWAARRTAHTNDQLSPRLVMSKVRASTQMTPRVRKPSRHDRA